jgi:hypothetical protein
MFSRFLQLLVRLMKEIVKTFVVSNPKFEYLESCNPKRYLIVISIGVLNNSSINKNHDLIFYFGRVLAKKTKNAGKFLLEFIKPTQTYTLILI